MRLDDFEADELLSEGEGKPVSPELHAKIERITGEAAKKTHITGMYKDWFLDYASYVILERAVPHLDDGLKPVQRRILHAMKRLDDGRYNKVANIIGYTMQYHPHGDASIGEALVQLGQKDLLIDTQGNWGNILTGDSAAAPRYIEARLSKFALEVVFNPKTTEWMLSYDGRNQEPVTLPVKFPLLLAQGVEGIAVGLASKILPHNFNELIDAAISYLKGKDFELYPDFPTGGLADCSRYNDGLRGGAVKVRARIQKLDRKTLAITEIPFGKTTTSLIESILKANDKGKIKIKRIDDNTAENVEILIHLHPDANPDMTIDALYAFTDCEMSISTNSCVIYDDKPRFMGVKDILRASVDRTKELLTMELNIRLAELEEDWHFSSLEKIFFEERIYRELEKDTETWDLVIEAIERGFDPYRKLLRREITRDDILKLTEKPVRKISKFDIKKADEHIKAVEAEMEQVKHHLANIVTYTIDYYQQIKKKYGKGRDRKTELRSFDTIVATKVVVANEKLYVNRAEGFVGTGLKKDEYVCDCSDIDDVIVILRNGKYYIRKVQEKDFFGKDIVHVGVYKKNDTRTIYNVVYRDGLNGDIMMKRCAINGTTRDKEYDITKGTQGSQILWLSANPNGETEVLKVYLKPRPRLRNLILELDFSQLAVKGRGSQGNIFTRYAIHKIMLKEKIAGAVEGVKVWYDPEVMRLNHEGQGELLGEFLPDERVLVVNPDGTYFLANTNYALRFDVQPLLVEKFNPHKVFSAVYFDGEQKQYYLKRFRFEPTEKTQSFIPDEYSSKLIALNADVFPALKLVFGGKNANREPENIDVDAFIAVKGYKAKGKRLTTFDVKRVEFIEPLEKERSAFEEETSGIPDSESEDNDSGSSAEQMSLEL
ncbi:MAG: DNA gyrase/topoisomerase IV subunit A [Tenuifilum sp.]|uniref:DNA gyrase/topoisomerase IV subunit A n=1 Tax=Tenuifilum sp. TaxID=2760880 RepID=UPI002B8E8F4F|nr:DNA gyrase/topoisomerase IV subunit A [Tenuifilum sp.]HOK85245.1 DNA gyrase/topoisomerase IV subunit A [Tenuifilum sp.]HON71377.1 DNA gyrase/topoisomerase IV subunit A [Tenuifilum sp.]HOU75090.1 DNA gyrase/topoisomerase IV subunit A [Tenuifilum sp.]HPP90542.1 DNA gyrase/topoisomerase IV subunit A [Tenuifilum sp.]